MSQLKAFSVLSILSFAIAAAGGDAPRLPLLTATSATGSSALELADLEIAVTIQGHLARTEYVMTYRNDLDRELRADFLFPLPAGAHLSDVGLYFDDELRRASVVSRNLGRTAYENVVPRFVSNGRDPILAEWTTGNSFRYDVYPIPRRGEKKIYVAYDEDLSGDAYELDLRYRNRFRHFRIEVDAEDAFDYEGSLELDCDGKRCSYEGEGVTVDARLRVRGSSPATPVALMELGSDGLYYLSLPLDVHLVPDSYPATGHLTLFWDASGTTAAQSLSVLQAFLVRLVDAQARPVDVTVVPFHAWKEPSIDIARADTENGRDALQVVLQSIAPVGGTYLPPLLGELQNVPQDSRIVLVTDGLSSMGPHDDLARTLASLAELHRNVLVVNTSPVLDVDMLEGIARATRGWYVDARGADDRAIARQVERAMSFPRFLTEANWEVALDRGISSPVPVGGPGRLSLTARLAKPVARGEVRLRFDGPRGASFERLRFVTERTAQNLGLVRSQWARDRLEDLLVSGDGASIREHGIQHHLLTPETSLVVLETWRDYLTNGVDMPPDVRQNFDAFLESEKERRREWEEEWRRIVRREGGSSDGLWTLVGRIEDEHGGVLPGVVVTVSSWERGTESVAVTDEQGRFRILATSAPGAFGLRAELRGFQTLWYEFADGLPSGTELEPFVMGLAGVCESVTVSLGGTPPRLQLPSEKTELPPGGSVVSFAASPSREQAESWRFAHWLDELGLEGMPLPQNWVRTRRGLAKRVAGSLADSDRSDRDTLEMYVAARSVLGPSKWLAAETARSLFASRPAVAARIASELVEHDAEEPGVARTVAQLFEAWDRRELVEPLLLRALEQAPHEPQSYLHWIRFGYRGEGDSVWDWVGERLSEPPPLALRRDVERAIRFGVGPVGAEPSVFRNANLQVELVWDGRSVDLDLEVVEPSGRRAGHRNRDQPRPVGWLSENMQSYGPEVYSIQNPAGGSYTIRVRYARTGQMELEAATLGVVTVYRRNAEGNLERSAHPFVLGGPDETWEMRADPD